MAVPRQLDTSETLPALSATPHSLPTTTTTTPTTLSKRPLQADSELTRAQKHTERLRRKRQKRRLLHAHRLHQTAAAQHSHKLRERLDKETALKALEQAKNVVIDESARRRVAPAVLFKKTERKSLLRKDRGFGKR